MGRYFSDQEHEALYVGADGKCVRCGESLPPEWHADHMVPFSKGGATDVINGQATCPKCNLEKGARMIELRPWQERALSKIQENPKQDFLIVATPGAGKTLLAIVEAKRRIENGTISRLVIICPTRHLVTHWINKANAEGLDLSDAWPPDPEARGVVVTYSQVTHHESLHRYHCQKATMVIFDEIHHAGHELSWGSAILDAFAPASFRLALSGTPFRSDKNRIPFITYINDYAHADHTYGYAEALDDGVCRPVFFPRYGGRAEWMWAGEVEAATFEDNVDEATSSRRLRTVLTSGDWLPTVLQAADIELNRMRSEHHNAAGLVIAMDQRHAESIAAMITRDFKTAPVLAISDEPDASEKIERFARPDAMDRWLVAVRMVSEGVDIPRLRVGVYATNVTAELFFRQAVGRVVRVLDDIDENTSAFYIPDDPTLRGHAEQIKIEREHHLNKESAKDRNGEGPSPALPGMFTPLDSNGISTGVTYDGSGISVEELERAERLGRQVGLRNSPAVAQLLRLAGLSQSSHTSGQLATPRRPMRDRKKILRTKNAKLVGRIYYRTGWDYDDINRSANEAVGIWSVDNSTSEQQLEARLAYLQKELAKVDESTGK